MGTWGAGIFENDAACDVRDWYEDLISEGLSIEEAVDKLIDEFADDADLESEYCGSFWLPLAKIQLESGNIEKKVKEKAIEIIERDIDLRNWEGLEADEKTIREREQVLLELRKSLGVKGRKKKYKLHDARKEVTGGEVEDYSHGRPKRYRKDKKNLAVARKEALFVTQDYGEEYETEHGRIIKELNDNGFDVEFVMEYKFLDDYLSSAEEMILLKHLGSTKNNRAREVIVYALRRIDGEIDGKLLAEIYEDLESDSQLRWAIAGIIAFCDVTNVKEWVVEAVKNPVYADSRYYLVIAIAKLYPYVDAIEIIKGTFNDLSMMSAHMLGCIGKDEQVVDFLNSKLIELDGIVNTQDIECPLKFEYESVLKEIPRAIDKVKERIVKKEG